MLKDWCDVGSGCVKRLNPGLPFLASFGKWSEVFLVTAKSFYLVLLNMIKKSEIGIPKITTAKTHIITFIMLAEDLQHCQRRQRIDWLGLISACICPMSCIKLGESLMLPRPRARGYISPKYTYGIEEQYSLGNIDRLKINVE